MLTEPRHTNTSRSCGHRKNWEVSWAPAFINLRQNQRLGWDTRTDRVCDHETITNYTILHPRTVSGAQSGNKWLHLSWLKTATTLQNAASGKISRGLSTSREALKMHRTFLKLLRNYSSEKKPSDRIHFLSSPSLCKQEVKQMQHNLRSSLLYLMHSA